MRQNISRQNLSSITKDLLPSSFGIAGKVWVGFLFLVSLAGLYFYTQQLRNGLIVTGLRDYTVWGIYISNFVFFVAISLVGSLISAILKLSGAQWSTPLTRISEVIAVAAIIFAGLIIIIDMLRPDRFVNVILYARIQSPITWDVIVITTYLFISLLLLYLPMIPDLAILRDKYKGVSKWQHKMYAFMANNWRGLPEQKSTLHKSTRILAVLIIPVAFGIHTVTSWLFATTFRSGWDSTNFGPYFISGAFMVGAGAVIMAMFVLRKAYKLDSYITDDHFDKMDKLLVLLSLVYLYFNINEYFVPAYKMKGTEADHLRELFVGDYALMFWFVQILGLVVPIIVLLFAKGRKPLLLFVMSVLVVVGAWFKRFLIVIPTLNHPFFPKDRLPDELVHYTPTLAEWSITIGTLAGFLLVITFLVRYFPIIPIQETYDEIQEKNESI